MGPGVSALFERAAGLLDGGLRVLRFQPSGPLDPNTTYEVALKPGLLGAEGAAMPAGLSWTFTTGAPTGTLSNQVVFLSDRAGIANLWAMNPDGTNQRQLSAELSPVVDYAIAPDGRAFLVADGATIISQRADGSARRLLTDTGVIEFDPAFSPDGSSITFGRADPALGTGTGLIFPNRVGFTGGPFSFTGGASPVLGLTLTDVLGTFNLDLALAASEANSLLKVVSAPKVTTSRSPRNTERRCGW